MLYQRSTIFISHKCAYKIMFEKVYFFFSSTEQKKITPHIRTLWKIYAMLRCIRKQFRHKVCTRMISSFIETTNYLNRSHQTSLALLIFSFFCCSLSNLLKDLLVSSQPLAAPSSKCCSGRLDRMKQETLLPVSHNDMILACTFLPLGRKSFLWSSYFTSQCVPQKQETLLQDSGL